MSLKEPAALGGSQDQIQIYGAREHNLKNISCSIPRNCFVVVTGVSGSGKSTLAFDLLFSEGQRRFLDSMNVYARQFIEQLSRPDVDLITGIPPAVSIEQRTSRGGGKSTVATVTEVYHFARLLFARLGVQYCPDCAAPVGGQTRDELTRSVRHEVRKRGALRLLAPVVRNRKGFHTDVAEWADSHGYQTIRADGQLLPANERLRLDRFREHNVEVVTGVAQARMPLDALQNVIDQTLKLGEGVVVALDADGGTSVHSTERSCPECRRSFEALDPKNFSYNSPRGWCPKCRGFGEIFYLPDVERGARAEAIEESWFEWQEGNRERCAECGGSRLNAVARATRLFLPGLPSRHPAAKAGLTPDGLAEMSVDEAAVLLPAVHFTGREAIIARDILPEIGERLKFLKEVGLGYLQLGRAVPTLSGGEAQRIRLAAQLGSNLSGVLYILDEPTIGLHARDNDQLLAALEKLRSRGNSVLVVEHDEETMRRADYVLDLGPGAGIHGGQVVAAGTLSELMRHPESVTGRYLRAKRAFPRRGERRPVRRSHEMLTLAGAAKNNLQRLTVKFPLNRLVLVSGVSGSGKSTLVRECLLPAVENALKGRKSGKRVAGLAGFETIHSVYEVNQAPIGRTPRSIPATYVGFFDEIRRLFAALPEARLRGYSPSRFSFNSKAGRCPECEGAGTIKLEMSFLPPAFIRCEACEGCRFNRETLDIAYAGKNIAQVLALSVEDALGFFTSHPKIKRPLQALVDTGLAYIKLGQTSPTFSGGEAQRIKLVTHLLAGLREPDLLERKPRRNLFILEEPTIGLHMADVQKLVEVLQRLVDAGHTVIVIEHNLELVAEADWVIDLGPEGGDAGGRIVAQGTPEEIVKNLHSHTGRFLKALLGAK